ncbi:hypothetical protein NQ317_015102 [Molorchus minor]|uniref:Peroxidase n=1 Tax=Molorchus minor TaxID=1323400 RepID=A0ABQ9K5N2_9CUCU|nr:hypothetical protein NQ317_015102 [Molorchus minor]
MNWRSLGKLSVVFLTPLLIGYGYRNEHPNRYPNMNESGIEITQKDLDDAVKFAQKIVDQFGRLEENLGWSQIKVKHGTPSHGMMISFGPDREAVRRAKDALIATKASVQLMNSFCHRSTRGEAFTGYSRLLEPDYLDGVNEPRRAVNRKTLPGPRVISNALVKFTDRPDNHFTAAMMHWGQFIEHDLSQPSTPVMLNTEEPIECCSENGFNLSPRYVHPFCYPITTPSTGGQYHDDGFDCMNYVRSQVALRPDCSFGPREQINQVSHYLDGSQIYGSTYSRSVSVRSFIGGKLNTSHFNGQEYLPLSNHPTKDCQVSSSEATCFRSGDSRVNFQPELTAMHTVWFREHNRIAGELATLNGQWDDEKLFQEARRLVVAEMQHITYSEWLTKALSNSYYKKMEASTEYSEDEDPTVSNSFATAAVRSIKSLDDGTLNLIGEDHQSISNDSLSGYFNNPEVIPRPNALDAIVRALATLKSQKIDVYYPEAFINRLYAAGHLGFDILSVDIQKGRDHGLHSYVHYLHLCGHARVARFDDLIDVMPQSHADALGKVYAHVSDVDLIVGGLMELPEGESLFGPTFSCVLADQFRRTKKGDRYFYTNKNQPKPFSTSQLNEIKKVTLARIFCDNTKTVAKMQPSVFKQIGEGNELVGCSSLDIPRINLMPWMENRERYHH